MPACPKITPEQQLDPSIVPPLDPTLISNISGVEWKFLRDMISEDDEVITKKLLEIQAEGYAKWPYPCIRAFHFVSFMMYQNAVYPEVVEAGKKGDTLLLDLGCCMGTDLRKLAQDGHPESSLLGCYLRPEYIQLGYKLYDDRNSCAIQFFSDNVLDLPFPPSSPDATLQINQVTKLAELAGRLTHIYTGALFHLFDESTQEAMALRVASLIKRESGSIIFGRHQGLATAGYIQDHMDRSRYGHSPSSWTALWQSVFAQLTSEEWAKEHVKVEASLSGTLNVVTGRESRMLYWSIRVV
ncbi:hypothetical protein NEOLEDRAFT_1092028 [Neolentinus lepideus HHB14362 ss-1]|uniref:Uncharacterized protein n=1 Tax=Neolentinus lepideus HHB14362 ss-1 TaxID=1314782 RepID=A0A165T1G2_9AGAM|nr:hypothetical protein NEOLEDRAFT_1092028 [Neolentinus lepideus HHB14362 ss-1]